MANKKFSEMDPTVSVTGGESVPVVQSGVNKITTPAQIKSYIAAEPTANKVTSVSGASTNVQFPSAKLLYDQLLLKQSILNGTGFIKAAGTDISYDNSTYLTSLDGAVLKNQGTPQTVGATGARLGMLWVTDITVTNPISGDITGDAAAATNLLGGAGGTIPYQSAGDTTQMLANGSIRQVLTSAGGTNAPTWKDLDARVTVADADYVVTGTTNKTVAFTSISTKRTVTLPAASTLDQIIRIVDESGGVSPVNRIKVVTDGTDTVHGHSYDLQISHHTNALYKSNGSGKWFTSGMLYSRLSAGMVVEPTLTDNGGGSITVGDGGLYNLYSDGAGLSDISTYEIAGDTLSLDDLTLSFVVADYNSGMPVISKITGVLAINETTVIPMFTIFRDGEALHINSWDSLGLALTNKLHQSIVKTQRFRLESGLAIGESTGRRVTVASGIVWTGAVKTILAAFTSATDNLYYMYHVGGVWQTPAVITVYNNSQYDNGTAVASLNPNKYAVNYVYRSVDATKECFLVLGNGDFSLLEAQGSLPPTDIPVRITSHCILVGRIIVKNGDVTATQIDSIFAAAFALSTSVDHNDLSGLQGGSTTERYHLTSAQATIATQAASTSLAGYLTAANWNTFNGKVPYTGATGDIDLGIHSLLATGIVLDKATNTGVKVDLSAPTFGWKDLIGSVTTKGGGASNPAWTVYRDTLYQYAFIDGAEKESWFEFHMPHDYLPGSDMYIHAHWSQKVVDTGGAANAPGNVEWIFDMSYSDGYGTPGGAADPFNTIKTIPIVQQGSTTQYGHMIAEVIFTGASDDSTHFLRTRPKIDGLWLVRIHRDNGHANDTLNQMPFLHYVDIHYQTNGVLGTKSRNTPFYS